MGGEQGGRAESCSPDRLRAEVGVRVLRAQTGDQAGPDPLCPVVPEGSLDSVLRCLGRKLVQNPSERVGP